MDIDVKHVAELARLSLSEDELQVLEEELRSILSNVEKLAEVNVDGVSPSFGCNFAAERLDSISDEDKPRAGLLRAIAFLAAPSTKDEYYKVPREEAKEAKE